jgi:hypothetical protein
MCGIPALDMQLDITPQQPRQSAGAEQSCLREVKNWQKATRAELGANAPGLTTSATDAAILISEIMSGNAAAYY